MDLKWNHDDMIVADGELVVDDSLIRDIEFEILTPYGSHWYYKDYGVSIVGKSNTPELAIEFIDKIKSILEKHGIEDAHIRISSADEYLTAEIFIGKEVLRI